MDSRSVYQNTTYVLVHEQMRLLSGDAFSLCALKFLRLNSESAPEQAQLTLKGNGRWDSDWFIAHYTPNTPITHEEKRDNRFRPCARARRPFFHR